MRPLLRPQRPQRRHSQRPLGASPPARRRGGSGARPSLPACCLRCTAETLVLLPRRQQQLRGSRCRHRPSERAPPSIRCARWPRAWWPRACRCRAGALAVTQHACMHGACPVLPCSCCARRAALAQQSDAFTALLLSLPPKGWPALPAQLLPCPTSQPGASCGESRRAGAGGAGAWAGGCGMWPGLVSHVPGRRPKHTTCGQRELCSTARLTR